MNISTNQVLHLYVGRSETLVKGGTDASSPLYYIKVTQYDNTVKTSPKFSHYTKENFNAEKLKVGKTSIKAENFDFVSKGYWYTLTIKYGGFSVEDANVISVSYQATADGEDILAKLSELLKAECDKLVNEDGEVVLLVSYADNAISVVDEYPIFNTCTFVVNNIKCFTIALSCNDEILAVDTLKVTHEMVESNRPNGVKFAAMEHFAKGERGGQINYRGWPYYNEKGEKYYVDPTTSYNGVIYHCEYYGSSKDYHSTNFDVIVLTSDVA